MRRPQRQWPRALCAAGIALAMLAASAVPCAPLGGDTATTQADHHAHGDGDHHANGDTHGGGDHQANAADEHPCHEPAAELAPRCPCGCDEPARTTSASGKLPLFELSRAGAESLPPAHPPQEAGVVLHWAQLDDTPDPIPI